MLSVRNPNRKTIAGDWGAQLEGLGQATQVDNKF